MNTLIGLIIALLIGWCDSQAAEASGENDLRVESRTPAQWLAVIRTETELAKQDEASHPDQARLLLGICWRDCPNELASFPAAYREAYADYLAWWERIGKDRFAAWRAQGFPPASDLEHQFLVDEAVLRRKEGADLEAYSVHLAARGKELMLKGCSGARLTRPELDELRCFAIYQCHHVDHELMLPGLLGWMPSGVAPGMAAPDFTLPRLDEVLASPTYSDRDPNDRRDQYRPIVLTELLQIMDGYTAAPHPQPGALVVAKPYHTTVPHAVTLSSFRGKKPVLLMCSDATDTWCYCGRVAPLFEPLYRSIQDRVEVFFIHTTCADVLMWGGAPWSGNPEALTWAYHPLSVEARARTAKMTYMMYPALSMPYLLDDAADHLENAYHDLGGNAGTTLVDRQGIVSFSSTQDACYAYLGQQPEFANQLSPYPQLARHMSLVECNLKALLDAGGVWSAAMKPVIPDWQISPMQINVPITAVDAQAGTMTIATTDRGPMDLLVDDQTRIEQHQRRVTATALAVGQRIEVMYVPAAGRGRRAVARQVVIGDHWGDIWITPRTWVPATIAAVDAARHTVTVTMTLDAKACAGPALWRSATPPLFYSSGLTNAVPTTFQAVAAQQGHRLVLHTDRATEVTVDGMSAQVADLRIGDRIGMDLVDGFQIDGLWPHFIRVYRF